MLDIAIATCSQLPDLDPDDHLFVKALENLGARVTAVAWNDPGHDWGQSELCVVRSTWDYHKDPQGFLSWIHHASHKTKLLNPPDVLRWNIHKFYLKDLAKAGVAIVPTFWLRRRANADLRELLDCLGWSEAVIKPAHGASADGVLHVRSGERESGQVYLTSLLKQQDALLQPYLPTISSHHERALVFIGGEFSHAVTKMPFMHAGSDVSLRAALPPGASGEMPVEATEAEIAVATRALEASPPGHVFARVDVVNDGTSPRVLEVELIEPTIYFYACPKAAEKLADAVVEYAASLSL